MSSICARVPSMRAVSTWLNTLGTTSAARMPRTRTTTRISIRVKPATRPLPSYAGDTQHLLRGGDPGGDLPPAVRPQRTHALGERDLANLVRSPVPEYLGPEFVIH